MLKFNPSKKTRFSKKTAEPQMKHEIPRSSEKSPAVATLIATVRATRKCVRVTLCVFPQGLSLAKYAKMRYAGVD